MSARLWPFVPVALLIMCVATQAVLFVAARSQPGLRVEPNYYEKAQRWDERQAEARAAEAKDPP